MITLTILRSDGSTQWTEYFNEMAQANAWIAEEQTRPYWDNAWTYTIVAPPAPTESELTAQALEGVRATRDALIDSTRWVKERHEDEQDLGIATTLAVATYQAWLNYWQTLRSLPDQPGFDPNNVVWPARPNVKG